MQAAKEKIEIESATSQRRTERMDRGKYMVLRQNFLPVLPKEAPHMTATEAKAVQLSTLSQDLLSGCEKAGWRLKAVQLDPEAKGVIEHGGKGP